MKRKNNLSPKAIFIMSCLILFLITGLGSAAWAATAAIAGFNDTGELNVPKTGSITPVKIDDDVTVTGSGSFADGYLLLENSGGYQGDMLSLISDANPNAYGAISLSGSTLYLGTGSGKKQIGAIDETLNGQDGKALKILFATPLPNGGFESGSDNWNYTNSFVKISGDANATSGRWWLDSSNKTSIEVKTKNPYFNWNWVETADGSSSYMRLYLSAMIDARYGTLHGPKITSNTFEANQGDAVSLNYYAKNTGDKFDVYGYVRDVNTGAVQQLFYQRGDETNGWQKVSAQINLPSSKNFVFEFLCGSQDGTGGQIISSELLVDNVRVVSNQVDAQVVTNVARKVALTQASQSPRTSASDRVYTMKVMDANGNLTSAGTTATVKINTYPAAPSLAVSPAFSTTDTLNAAWQSAGAVSYDVYLDGSKILNTTGLTGKAITGLETNIAYMLKAAAQNDMGSSDETTVTKYTNASVPSLSAVDSSSNQIYLSINTNSNPAGTTYLLERSVNGIDGWNQTTYQIYNEEKDKVYIVNAGLAPNTVYYYRVCARNGDGINTEYSDIVSRMTAPAAPNPVTVTVVAGQDDALKVNWTATEGALSYDVYVDDTKTCAEVTGTDATVDGLIPNTAYNIYVKAKNENGDSVAGPTVSKYTLPATPAISTAEAAATSITCQIANNNNPVGTAYCLEQSIDDTNWTPIENYTMTARAGAAFSHMLNDLNSGITYYYRLKAKNGDGEETGYSETFVKKTLPSAPSGLTVTPEEITEDEEGQQVVANIVTWTAPVGAESFDVYQKAAGESNFSLIASAYDGTMLEDTGLSPNKEYTYYIVAKNSSGDSAPGSEVARYTLAAVPGIASASSGDTNNLTIDANGNPNGTEYFIQYSTDSGVNWTTLEEWITYSPQHEGITSGITYTYRVKARNGDGVETAYSGSASARANTAPVVVISAPTANTYCSAVTGYSTFTLSGTVSDAESDVVRLAATIDGQRKTTVVNATPTGAGWSLSWDMAADNIAESAYNSIEVTADDGFKGYQNVPWDYLLYVDRTGPERPAVDTNSNWTNAQAVAVTITPGADGVAGSSWTQYMLSGAMVSGWTTYNEGFAITNAGETTITARTIDAVGNTGTEQNVTVKIDRSAPAGTLTVVPQSGSNGATNSQIVNLNLAASDTGGSGDGAGNAAQPKEMQFSNDGSFGDSWESFSTERDNWTIDGTDGTNTVYVRFRDAAGNISAPVSGDINMDTGKPVITISSPSSFNVKKGMTVTYELTVSEESTLTGINSDDTSCVDISLFGTFSEDDIAAIQSAVTITQHEGDTTHRTVNINIPAGISNSEGTIGIRILAGAAEDAAGNRSELAIGNASFVIDAVAPDNQDILFPVGVAVQGGYGVSLAQSSEECPGGYDSDSVRFAPAGYDGTAPANGATITSTHGRSTVINAPTQEGTYYLYIVDAAGNISPASIAVLTVKNNGPTLSITGPSLTHVKQDSSVEYVVTYSADTAAITLTEGDVALVTTGTANAYVAISNISGQPLQKKITLYNLMGQGLVQLRVGAGSATDLQGNLASASALSDAVSVDNTPAAIQEIFFISNNGTSENYARRNDTLTLSFSASEDLSVVSGSIAGQTVTFNMVDANASLWSAQYTIPAGMSENMDGEQVPFVINMTDLAGNVSTAVTEQTSGCVLTLDFILPEVTVEGGEPDVAGRYQPGVNVTFNEGVGEITITNGSGTVTDTVVSGTVLYDEGSYQLTVTDMAGNTQNVSFVISAAGLIAAQDIDTLAIGYAPGDSASSVTQDITLPAESASGADVTWEITTGGVIAINPLDGTVGNVTRPAYADGNAAVTIDASITIDGITQTKQFVLTVKALPNNIDGLANVCDDAEYAQITYAYGDTQNSVTQDVALSSIGLLHGSALTWVSDNPAIQIAESAMSGKYETTVTRPALGEDDATVTLTVTAADPLDPTKTYIDTFVLTVKAIELTDGQKANADYENVQIVYAAYDSEESVTQNLTFQAAVNYGSTITWQSSDESVIATDGTVTRPGVDEGNKDVTITATITNGTAQITRQFLVTVIRKELSAAEGIALDRADLAIHYYGSDTAENVTTHVLLPTIGDNGSTVTWISSNEEVVATDGTVERPSEDTAVTLTAQLAKGEETADKEFVITVKAIDNDDSLSQIKEDTDNLEIIYADGDENSFVTHALTLRTTGANGCTITWASDNESVIASDGTVNRPNSDATVTLTATVKKYAPSIGYWVNRTKTFSVIVAKKGYLELTSDLDDVYIRYASGDSAASVTSSLYLMTAGETGCTITWASSNTDYVTDRGKVTRPSADDTDRKITLTATVTNPLTGESGTKTFAITVKKMTDEDTVQYAAKNLSAADAFTFSNDNDIWESVTDQFLILTEGVYDTSITWTSSDPAVIAIGGVDPDTGKLVATVTRPASVDANVILTAKFTLNNATATKTYLMVVKKADATKTTTRAVINDVVFELSASSSADQLPVYRTVVDNEGEDSNIDTVIFDPAVVQNLADNIDPQGSAASRTLTLTTNINEENGEETDEQAIEIPSAAVGAMADRNMILSVSSPFAGIKLEEQSLQKLSSSGTDLYFRVAPMQDEADIAAFSLAVIAKAGNSSVLIGTPVMVETNYSGVKTSIILPLNGALVSDYDDLMVYINHSDGTTELVCGTLVYEDGSVEPYGLEITVMKFSEFQIVERPSSHHSSGTTTAPGGMETMPGEELQDTLSGGGTVTVTDDDVTVELTGDVVDWDDLTGGFGDDVTSGDITVKINIKKQTGTDLTNTQDVLTQEGLELVGTPVDFSIDATYNNTVKELTTLNGYVTLTMPLADGQKITTAVRVAEDGSIIHIPTEVVTINGADYAKIHSLVSGTFALIWNPLAMNDVANHWAREDVNDMASRLVVEGTANGVYEPNRAVTRAEFAAMLVRGLGLLRGVGEQSFADVRENFWYAEYIQTATTYGLIYGYGDGNFGPKDTITREQAMAMIYRAMRLTGLSADITADGINELLKSFSDANEIAAYALQAAAGCLQTGIFLGRDHNTLQPQQAITRAETAVIIRRLLQKSQMID